MAAVAGATISSCLSARRVNSKHVASFDCVFRIGCRRTLQVASLSHVHLVDSLSIKAVTNKWRNVRIAASVIEEELAGAVEVESVEEKVEEKEVVEELGEVEAKAEAEPEAEAESEVKDEPTINTKLYIGNLPYNCDSAQLAGIIQEYGSPELIELYGGRPLRVNFSDKPKPKEPLYHETEYKLFVGNLSWSVTSESLTEAFKACGDVVGARVLYDGDTGRSRGYGFVCFNTKEEMEAALTSLDGMEIDGRPMRVSIAQGKKR
ncbi:hypothetical protein AQUCO_03400265v1 [Aquilegia coerulea]|uniref:RRM domain-containing protein n=1 Tax=Aquilegia coerulea TaxID=218851 RepID=A0A2G5CY70_AQUCA|nr:hypothetical protein AQUCO_03400265v1 [Aquilegia coerulea]